MKKITILLSSCLAIIACHKTDVFTQPPYSLETSTKLAGAMVSGAPAYFGHVKSDKETKMAPGVSLLDFSYLNMNGYAMQMYLYSVALGSATINVTTPDNGGETGSLQKLTLQAQALEKSGVIVYGAINGDSYTAKTLKPTGIEYKGGVAVKTTFDSSDGGFFAILNDGTAFIGEQEDYSSYRKSLKEAIGTKTRILKNGNVVPQSNTKLEARTFVAVSEDGTTAFIGVLDGVYFYYSNGISLEDLGTVLKAAGAYNAAVLDAGATTTLLKRTQDAENPLVIANTPSDNGLEKDIVNGLAIIQN